MGIKEFKHYLDAPNIDLKLLLFGRLIALSLQAGLNFAVFVGLR